MSKKLIAVAAAAALALTGLVGIAPANATAFAVTINGESGGTGSDATTNALTIAVPSQDTIRWSAANVVHSAIQIDVTATTSTGAVTVTSTGAIKLLTQAQLDDTDTDHKSGTQSVQVAAVSNNAKIYAFTTSTTAGTITVSNGGNTSTYFLRGTTDKGYFVTANAPTSATKNADFKYTVSVKDMFNNPVSGIVAGDFAVSALGAFDSGLADTDLTFTEIASNKGTYNVTVPAAEVTASGAGLITMLMDTDTYDQEETSFGKRSLSVTLSVSSADPSVQIASLTAQVTALTAQLAASRPVASSVTKKRYNTLARKWNAANPGARVALKK
jgi:hypothetical protein